jgi:hypothetical protein
MMGVTEQTLYEHVCACVFVNCLADQADQHVGTN